MNKQDILAALQSNATVRTGTRLVSNRTYTISLEGDIAVKLPPQAQALLRIIFEDDRMVFTEPQLYDLFLSYPSVGKKQTSWEVFRFYRPLFEKAGWMVVKG